MEAREAPSDDAAVEAARQGDLEAFNVLVDRYQSTLFNVALRLTGSRECAEDVTQEAFLSAYRSLARFEGGTVRSWLIRIAANEAKDELRRRSRKDLAVSLQNERDSFDQPIDVADQAPDVGEAAERGDLARIIQAALLELPDEQRLAIVLVDLQGLDYNEAAAASGMNLGTLKSRLNRGRLRLRQHFLAHPELIEPYRRLER